MERSAFYRTIWRWHFYAALFVVPMVLILATTGPIYLFKPQIERWEERSFEGLSTVGSVTPEAQLAAALAAVPGGSFQSYRLPQKTGDAVLINVKTVDGQSSRDVFVSPQGKVVGILDPDKRIAQLAHDVHGQLLLGPKGSWLVELAACWAIVMIITGLYLWWPRGSGLTGVIVPRTRYGGRVFWRDLHAVAGFWVSAFALVLLVTGLPWTDVWGRSFKTVRAEMGWVKGKQDWTTGGRSADADEHAQHAGMMMAPKAISRDDHHPMMPAVSLGSIVVKAQREHLAFPVLVAPPGAVQRAGPPSPSSKGWTVKSDSQIRPLRVTITYDPMTGTEVRRRGFSDQHVIDKVIGYGISWHEGQLFGLVNQLIGVATALLLITLTISGFTMWLKRKPDGVLGAPPVPTMPARIGGVVVIVLVLAALLPMLAISLVTILLLERFVLARIPAASRWLGLSPA